MSNNLLEKNCIIMDLDLTDKDAILQTMAQALLEAGRISDIDVFLENVRNREAIEPTALGDSIGMPHGKTDSVVKPSLAFARLKKPIVWNAKTGEEASIIMMIAVPASESSNHLKIISQLARNMMHDSFKNQLTTGDEESVYTTINNVLVEE